VERALEAAKSAVQGRDITIQGGANSISSSSKVALVDELRPA